MNNWGRDEISLWTSAPPTGQSRRKSRPIDFVRGKGVHVGRKLTLAVAGR